MSGGPGPRRALGTFALAALFLTAGGASAQQIGVVAAVSPDMSGRPPAGAAQVKSPGSPVVADETIITSASGRGQLLFRDQTTLSISPNSEIVLDGFVFDPDGGGRSGLSLTRGALRFIGGKNSREQEAIIRTPTAIIGVRGSSALISFEDNQTRAILIAGDRLCVAGACTNRQGAIMTEAGYQGQVSQADLAQTLGEIDGPPQRDAGFSGGSSGGGGGGGQAGTTGLGFGGGTGIAEVTGPDSDPVSSRGALRDFQVFDDDARSDAIVGITSGGTDVPLLDAAPDPLPDPIVDEVVPMTDPILEPDPVPEPEPVPEPTPDPDPTPDPPDGGGGDPPIIIIEPL